MRKLAFLSAAIPAPVFADGLKRPIPQPQTTEAELWFFMVSPGLLRAAVARQMLVRRR
ncbi:MAG: hypothetical protein WCD16_15340 [Paracoccaceae bacterium]